MRIEIRTPGGDRLASAETLSDAIEQLVELCGRYRKTVEDFHKELDEFAMLKPDTSATAPEHVIGFEAGWNAALRRLPFPVRR